MYVSIYLLHLRIHQDVSGNGSRSKWKPVRSGAPQGSILGPALFSVFVNKIDGIEQTISKLEDKTKLSDAIDSWEGSDTIQI